jgi:hypothetical protein
VSAFLALIFVKGHGRDAALILTTVSKVSKFQSFKVSRFQSFKVSRFRGIGIRLKRCQAMGRRVHRPSLNCTRP